MQDTIKASEIIIIYLKYLSPFVITPTIGYIILKTIICFIRILKEHIIQ